MSRATLMPLMHATDAALSAGAITPPLFRQLIRAIATIRHARRRSRHGDAAIASDAFFTRSHADIFEGQLMTRYVTAAS
jgi:hypothetical protein